MLGVQLGCYAQSGVILLVVGDLRVGHVLQRRGMIGQGRCASGSPWLYPKSVVTTPLQQPATQWSRFQTTSPITTPVFSVGQEYSSGSQPWQKLGRRTSQQPDYFINLLDVNSWGTEAPWLIAISTRTLICYFVNHQGCSSLPLFQQRETFSANAPWNSSWQ